jgi:hypothetical protein
MAQAISGVSEIKWRENGFMKNILSMLVILIGVVCIVFGAMFIMQAASSRDTVVDELAASGVTTETLNAAYDQAKAGLAQATAAGEAGIETAQSVGWQKASLGLAKSNLTTIDFVQKSGILAIVAGLGLSIAGVVSLKKS